LRSFGTTPVHLTADGAMAVIEERVSLSEETVARMQEELRAQGVDGWLLYNFQGLNGVASGILGLPAMSRRYFVLIPAEGRPVALTHRIEQQPWEGWIGEKRMYLSWRQLEEELASMLNGLGTVAMEYAEGDAVPYTDRVPAGVLEMVRAAGPSVVTSADLISAFYARWSEAGLEGHRRAAVILRESVHAAFDEIGRMLRAGEQPTEWGIREWIQERLAEHGLVVGVDTIVAVNDHAANPHYGPTRKEHAEIHRGDLVLIDLWGSRPTIPSTQIRRGWPGWGGCARADRGDLARGAGCTRGGRRSGPLARGGGRARVRLRGGRRRARGDHIPWLR
jgi:Xaa-Pro dipeptidase